ncbi:glycoside hydrolase family 65 protein [Lutibacter sp.]|uniref:glycosyl hydrolase family 95 catalytic domain-containing protein n=1 Tax=Lutibacter sp. TaxID=1925666 RepID=UPI0025BAA226|nr:glycoside hydrolase family 65 protein [Lutibacter sp.]MCF6180880.1 glycoside hydrolase family 65 protein [Lutibacter sp.]
MKTIFISLFALFMLNTYAQNKTNLGWKITAKTHDPYVGITLANGRIGLLPSAELFKVKSIILNNVFDRGESGGVSRVLEGINFANLNLEIDGDKLDLTKVTNWQQTLNMKEANFTTSFDYKNKAHISYTIYALRQLAFTGMITVNIKALKPISIKATGIVATPHDYKDVKQTYTVLHDAEIEMPIMQTTAKSRFGRQEVAVSANFLFKEEIPKVTHKIMDNNHQSLSFDTSLKANTSYNFAWFGAECTTQDFVYPDNESARMLILAERSNWQVLIDQHKAAWAKLWQGDIEIEGDLASQLDVRLALYHLYAFSRADSNLSLSPMGLSSQGYNGHVFWDTEIWMFPPLLMFNQDIAKSLLNYRSDRLEKAKEKARNFGYKGAMFPWESDDTGEEATPVWALTGTFEQHITADVGIAFYNYYKVTQDRNWLKNTGYPMLKEVADFWVSRSTQNADGTFSINNVVGANEFAQNIDDNAFTNGSAITVLNDALNTAKILGILGKKDWKTVADGLVIHKFKSGITKENSTYHGQIIKQADVNLLAYPLQIITDKKQILKDLNYYEPRFAKDGPAMAHSILAILYARLGNTDKAFELFKSSYEPNKRPPFGALSESATSNNPYFATGAGGLLQIVLVGFGGLHISENGIIQKNPILPKQWKSLTLKGVGPNKKTYIIKH